MWQADCQIAVLGGGIAGATACLRLANAGLRPIWIARPEPQNEKPGELLSAAARPILADLGVADLLAAPYHRPAHSMFSAWGRDVVAERSSVLHLEGPATVLDRVAFERDLRDRVIASGISPVSANVQSCQREGGSWHLTWQSGKATVDHVIDATGRQALVARNHAQRFRADRLAVLYGFLRQDPKSDVAPTQATLVESGPDGWWYATLLADGRLAVNYYSDADLLAQRATSSLGDLLSGSKAIRRWIDEAGFDQDLPLTRASTATVWIAPCAGTGWAAAGDASAAFDPLSSHGMTTALWSATKAADAVLASLDGDDAPLTTYADAVAKGVQDFLVARQGIYAQEARFPDSPFWKRRSGAVP